MTWGEKDGLVFVRDFDRNRRWSRTFLLNADNPSQQARLIWDRSSQDRYNDPGSPVMKRLPNGQAVIHQNGDHIFLSGQGASPKGDRPVPGSLRSQDVEIGTPLPMRRQQL